MSLMGIMNTALSGLTAQRVAIDVTSENVSNINTPGYSAQKPIFESTPTVNVNGLPLGSGVKVAQVQRNYDDMLQRLLKDESSTNGQSGVELTNMQSIEQLFPDLTSDGLGNSIQNYFNAWQDLSTNAGGSSERQAVLSSGQFLAQNFNQISSYLTSIKQSADKSISGLATEINDKLKSIASLNVQIQATEGAGANANVMLDQRDQLVRDLAEKIGIDYSLNPANGTMTITLKSSNPAVSGAVLVSGGASGIFAVTSGASNNSTISLTDAKGNVQNPVDLSSSGGEIGGTLNVRDNLVDKYLTQLDSLAADLAAKINAQHTAGFDAKGNPGIAFFTTSDGSATITSANIRINPLLDPEAAGSTDLVAAAGTKNSGPGDNANALAMAVLKSASGTSFASSYNSIVSSVGVGVQNARNAKDLSDGVLAQYKNLRESESGVSLDEEMTNLITYQKAFEGNSKMISTVAEMMDAVLNMVR